MGDLEAIGGWAGVLRRIIDREDLDSGEAEAVFDEILSGAATQAQVAGFLTALRTKGEAVEEMAGFVRSMLQHAEPLEVDGDLLDTCGTGGDRSSSVNVSTIAALVAAGAGARVCKHGNRAASSAAGSADVLEALGVVVDLDPAGVKRCIEEVGLGFCFAPRFHPAMRHAGPVRRELGVPTVFNFLGPLANPARARYQLVGVSDPAMAPKMIGVLAANGCRRAIVVHGADHLDEISTTGPNELLELEESGRVTTSTLDPRDFGLPPAVLDDLRGGDATRNAELVTEVLGGVRSPYRDIGLLNAAAGLVLVGIASDIAEGLDRAAEAVDSGAAARALDGLVRVSRQARGS